MRTLSYRITLRKEPEGGYTVLVPALPGCVTYGKTVEEAIEMAKDAINGYIESLIPTFRSFSSSRNNFCIPVPTTIESSSAVRSDSR